ncbi:MAG: hypothetical protein EBW54_11345 [Betaproteobacteria bacterium]|nr:hypothetical protein [Betaproteobacteria bacterium]
MPAAWASASIMRTPGMTGICGKCPLKKGSFIVMFFKTMGQRADPRSVFYFVGIDGARFKRPVGPGDQLHLKVSIVRAKGGLWKYDAQALVDEQLAVEAVLMCTMRKLEP